MPRDALALEAGLDVALSPAATLGVSYNGQVGDGTQDHGLSAKFALTF